ncbi:helix-turn-helix domain-containing protein [Bacillus thuringiensis]|nr:helix-turn-helix domain-containing protein [Bacillus thuringiensis]PFS28003.1 helix-turn-helix domain-containing protein [Bacillus thuringiensis]
MNGGEKLKRGVLDLRQNKFVMVTKAVIDDTRFITKPVDKLIYAVLCSYANNDTRESYPSVSAISQRARCSERTVRRSLRTLKELGLIDVKARFDDYGQSTNLYILLELPDYFNDGLTKKEESPC